MAYDFLKKLFGEPKDGEVPKAMTADELEAAINAASDIQVVNLKDGGYVSKDKFTAKETELSGVKKQLEDANSTIQSYQDMDIDGIKKSAKDWEDKYKTDMAALNQQLADQARSHAEEMFMSQYKFTSKAARNGVLAEFRDQKFSLNDDGTFKGAKEYMDSLMKNEDYKGAFVIEEAENNGEEDKNGAQGNQGAQMPRFAQGAQGTQGVQGNDNPFAFNFTRLRQPPQNQNNQ